MSDAKDRVCAAVPGGLGGGVVLKNSPECCMSVIPDSFLHYLDMRSRLFTSVVCYHLADLDWFIHFLSPRSATVRLKLPRNTKVHPPLHVSCLKPSSERLLVPSAVAPPATSGADGDPVCTVRRLLRLIFFFFWSDIK